MTFRVLPPPALASLAMLYACTPSAGDGTPRPTSVPSRIAEAPTLPAVPPSGAARTPAAGPEPVFERTLYDLVVHADHAELRQGPALVMDYGGRSGAKYTLGGWRTRIGPDEVTEGCGVATLSGTYGSLILPIDFVGAAQVTLRARAPRDGRFSAFLDEERLEPVKGDRDALEVFELRIPEDRATPGEHLLGLRGSGQGRVGRTTTGVAVDWVRVAPVGVAVSQDPPPDVAALAAAASALVIPGGYTLGYALHVPEGAALKGELRGEGDASLTVVAVTDGGRQELATIGARAGTLNVDLSPFAGRLVRLDLTARGPVQVAEARVIERLAQAPATTARKPVRNVLIYLIDTLRADHLKAFNPETRVRTPGMDALAKHAAVFTAAHTQENWTKPSVATLLSSLLPWEHHATTTEAVVPKSVTLLPEYLSKKGFFTGAFIANGYVGGNFGFDRGWDTYRNYIREGRRSRSQFLAADVLDWLDKRPQDVPFFLYVHSIDPHVPYRPTKEFLSLYDPGPYDGPVNFSHDFALLEKVKTGALKLSDRDKRHLEALYDSEISYHDVHFNAILQALESRGLADDTLVVVTADHGEEFWDHGSVGHGHNVYEELLHIPMLVRLPGATGGGGRIASNVGLVDVVPTVFDALGEPQPEGLSGRSFMPELLGAAPSAPAASISGFMDGWRAISIGKLKLIQRTEKRIMLHDLASDPGEQTDVSAERPISVRYLRGQLGLALSDDASAPASGKIKRKKKVHERQNTEIDAETEAQLQALGYVGTSRR